MASSLLVRGMHGLGDNIHQRAVIRALLKRNHSIALETSWPCVYHDLAGDDLRFIRKPVALRAQLKNAEREAEKFTPGPPHHHPGNALQISYSRAGVANVPSHSVLEAMFVAAGIPRDYEEADFRLPVPNSWIKSLDDWRIPLLAQGRPIMVYRPLVVRPEWRGSGIRNANPDQYAELVAMVRDSFFVVSVAALESNREWIVGPQLIADLTFNHGELPFEAVAALFSQAAVIVTSNGFPAILGPAVVTPTISVQGGYEPAAWLADGARHAPYLGIDTLSPCNCGTSACTKPCPKTLDMPRARASVTEFLAQLGISAPAASRPFAEIFSPATTPPPRPTLSAARVMPRVRALRLGNPALLNRRSATT